jgi:hypothetical protein
MDFLLAAMVGKDFFGKRHSHGKSPHRRSRFPRDAYLHRKVALQA